MVFVEAKRKGGSIKHVESQALEAALWAIDKYQMNAVYAMTTWGFVFELG